MYYDVGVKQDEQGRYYFTYTGGYRKQIGEPVPMVITGETYCASSMRKLKDLTSKFPGITVLWDAADSVAALRENRGIAEAKRYWAERRRLYREANNG